MQHREESTGEPATAAHPFLTCTQDPCALSDTLLPVLTETWPVNCLDMAKAAAAPPVVILDAALSGTQLPLLQHEDVVQCSSCKRMLLHEAHGRHQTMCAMLPIADLLAADAALAAPNSHNKSPNRDLATRPPSASGRASGSRNSGSGVPGGNVIGVSATGVGGSGGSGGCDDPGPAAMVQPPQPHRRSRVSLASSSRSGGAGRSGPRPLSAEAEQRRLQFERGQLTLDTVCGVRSGEKICLYPLNCKYHSVSLKRTVLDRTVRATGLVLFACSRRLVPSQFAFICVSRCSFSTFTGGDPRVRSGRSMRFSPNSMPRSWPRASRKSLTARAAPLVAVTLPTLVLTVVMCKPQRAATWPCSTAGAGCTA